ncbi:MAG: hypothetical protein LBV72_17605 [Tannerella sp.]|jgi:hypothetical protein|nr:hypothetical protein [Tannerella sp.]
MNEQINEQLVLLQEELSRLKKVTDYIDNAKANATVIINELEHIQQNYAQYTNDLHELYKQNIADLKEDVESKIENNILRMEEVGNRISNINQGLAIETRNLLEQYEDVVDASDSLIEAINTVDFHTKLDDIFSKTEELTTSGITSRQAIELKISETQQLIAEKNQELKNDTEKLILAELKRSKEQINEHAERNSEWQVKQEKEIKNIKVFSLIICGLVILSMIIMMTIK